MISCCRELTWNECVIDYRHCVLNNVDAKRQCRLGEYHVDEGQDTEHFLMVTLESDGRHVARQNSAGYKTLFCYLRKDQDDAPEGPGIRLSQIRERYEVSFNSELGHS